MVWTVAYRTCPAPVRACTRVHSYPSCLSRVFPRVDARRAHKRSERAAITANVGGGWRSSGHAHQALRTGVNYASREMSNCSPYRKIYNSSRCGKHYVPSPTPDTHSARSFPPCFTDSTPRPSLSPPIPGRGTIHHSLDELSDCRRGFSSPISLSFFPSIPNYFRGRRGVGEVAPSRFVRV